MTRDEIIYIAAKEIGWGGLRRDQTYVQIATATIDALIAAGVIPAEGTVVDREIGKGSGLYQKCSTCNYEGDVYDQSADEYRQCPTCKGHCIVPVADGILVIARDRWDRVVTVADAAQKWVNAPNGNIGADTTLIVFVDALKPNDLDAIPAAPTGEDAP